MPIAIANSFTYASFFINELCSSTKYASWFIVLRSFVVMLLYKFTKCVFSVLSFDTLSYGDDSEKRCTDVFISSIEFSYVSITLV